MSRPKTYRLNQSDAEIDFLTRPARELSLPDAESSECGQADGRLIFHPDGSGVWSCTTWNRNKQHSGVWRTDFVLRGLTGESLFGVGPFFSPRMEAGEPFRRYTWSVVFDFPTAYFSDIVSAEQNFGCMVKPQAPGDSRSVKRPAMEGTFVRNLIERTSMGGVGVPSFRAFSCL